MEYITNTLGNLVQQTAFLNLTWGNYIYDRSCMFFPLSCNQAWV